MKKLLRFFDRLEDGIRGKLSRVVFLYAFIGGVCHVLFWRGVWHTADILADKGGVWAIIFYEPYTIIWVSIILVLIGLFVSIFIGDSIIMSGIKHEKKVTEKTAEEILNEEDRITKLSNKIQDLKNEISEIKQLFSDKK